MYEFGHAPLQSSRPPPKERVVAAPAPMPATVLRHCRCQDCGHWAATQRACGVLPFRRFIPREDVPALIRRFWTDLGMVDPGEWHYCACYHGPQVSKDVWEWSRLDAGAKESPEPVGGRPGSGPIGLRSLPEASDRRHPPKSATLFEPQVGGSLRVADADRKRPTQSPPIALRQASARLALMDTRFCSSTRPSSSVNGLYAQPKCPGRALSDGRQGLPSSHHVPPRSTIAPSVVRPYGLAMACRHVAEHQDGRAGQGP